MEVIILAGGLGTRLRSAVSNVPKCMAPVAGHPFLWHLLQYLSRFPSVSRVILSVGYMRDVIERWVPTVAGQLPFAIDYAVETEPLGTGGGIRLAMSHVQGTEAVVLNGDTAFHVDLDALVAAHHSHPQALLTIALKPMRDFDRYGAVDLATDGRVLAFHEKQHCDQGLINGGVYVASNTPDLWQGIDSEKFSFETAVLERHCGPAGRLFALTQDAYFIDIGIPDDYRRAQTELLAP